ncbi:hypothetical protein COV24_04060 [candidate division WWE3 bacterium CG10_big_fil_rev_8_21_14_0_10_32_10]|uniref:DUF4349 domain-containing protein n=1 Tax=candidate division WWE3 bacterium CG10_big_fil_rev_8_21_14_0_10_32_10 TaxID=1975090 RepID=A0A2H0R9I6_UNCKA|nr:MAG: hypothetical protein COV24_04060 [candidate division WWE3 bacterium CG10_big_fil_rev_8_21_14_0_10_32_10]
MNNVIFFIKKNFLTLFLVVVVLYLLFGRGIRNPIPIYNDYNSRDTSMEKSLAVSSYGMGGSSPVGAPSYIGESVNTNIPTSDRKVIEEMSFSLKVQNVSNAQNLINKKAESLGGFMVHSNLSKPSENTSGTLTVRVPKDKIDIFNSFLREQALKVVAEDLFGTDVTDAYSDIGIRLNILTKNKERLTEIMDRASTVEDILKVQNQIFNLQDQIDSLMGQKKYLEEVSSSVKITIYLATDEYSLPYVPDTSFRPSVVFKEAVRALILNIRDIASFIIWGGVYSVIWVPALVILYLLKKKFWNKNRKV